jgi:hypothetical protein
MDHELQSKEETMINVARQAFANPFLSSVGASFQPGVVSTVGRCPCCGNAVAVTGTIQPQTGLNPLGVGATLGQQIGGLVPNPNAFSQTTGFGQINPLTPQFASGFPQTINPFAAQLASNWPVSGLSHQAVGGRTGAYGADPRFAFAGGQQFGYNDPNVNPGVGNTAIAGDPTSSLFSQQFNPLAQQQLPIRPLIGGQQWLGSQAIIPGIASPVTQWADPYRAFIEAQLISQLTNPLYQLQRAYGGVPEVSGLGMPFGAGQQFNPLFANVPFYG